MIAKYLTKQEFAEVLGLGYRTLQRRLKEANIQSPKRLLSPEIQAFMLQKLKEHELKKLLHQENNEMS